MCLDIKKNQEYKIAQRNITCYKVLKNNLLSPYQDFQYELNKLTKSELRVIRDKDYNYYTVSSGLHTLRNIEDAREELSDQRKNTASIYLAIIPKGAKYYSGYFFGMESFASNQLIIKKKIE